jgi:hypothetical protein
VLEITGRRATDFGKVEKEKCRFIYLSVHFFAVEYHRQEATVPFPFLAMEKNRDGFIQSSFNQVGIGTVSHGDCDCGPFSKEHFSLSSCSSFTNNQIHRRGAARVEKVSTPLHSDHVHERAFFSAEEEEEKKKKREREIRVRK